MPPPGSTPVRISLPIGNSPADACRLVLREGHTQAVNASQPGWEVVPTAVGECRWAFPDARDADETELVAVGGDLKPATLIAAYRQGLFPMPLERRQIGWMSPDPRGIIPLDGLRVSRSLRQSVRRYEVTVDASFEAVMRACGDPRRPHGWINKEFITAFTHLHELGWAHSVETWGPGGELVGGLYGVRIGGFFAGESMFSTQRDASKVALVVLVERMRTSGMELLDVQWLTPHLASLGAIAIPRTDYLDRVARATMLPQP